MIEYSDHFVAFLDILGFKSLLSQYSCDEIYPLFDTLQTKSTATLNYNGFQIKAFDHIQHMILSDSIVLFIRADIEDAFAALLEVCSRLQVALANRDDPILIRGGIVLGKLFFKDGIIYGDGLTKSYLLETNLAKYPRVVFSGDTLELGRANTKYMFPDLDQLSFNFRLDEDYLYFINYLPGFSSTHTDEKTIQYCDRLLNHCKKWLNREIDFSMRDKYIWLKKQVEKSIKCMPTIERVFTQRRETELRIKTKMVNAKYGEVYKSNDSENE